ncbi:hypothetical protein [Candidatus Magnetomonas plexicatena]|uniref:hypothetical protein n=1 Tax=Candidatus Magnetomonas plexicatena TaxID=2552947 RepID=UPI0011004B84|nr:hypothetical protein E2O03_012380 [Nitrospirales bacterium LBB_01]
MSGYNITTHIEKKKFEYVGICNPSPCLNSVTSSDISVVYDTRYAARVDEVILRRPAERLKLKRIPLFLYLRYLSLLQMQIASLSVLSRLNGVRTILKANPKNGMPQNRNTLKPKPETRLTQ